MAHTIDYKTKMEKGYDYSASFYDKRAGQSMTSFTHLFLDDLHKPANPVVLDVACGTGIATFELMKQCEFKGTYYGIDISSGMIEKAQANATRLGYENCVFQTMDAEHLEFPDDMFDVVISSGSFHWFPNKLQALAEMYRVLKPKGQVALRFNGYESWKRIFAIFIQLEQEDSTFSMTPGWTTIRDYFSLTLEEAYDLFDQVGFHDARIHGIHRVTYMNPERIRQGVDTVWAFWQIGLSDDIVERYKDRLIEEMQKQSTPRGFPYTSYWIIAYGNKPES
jgi:ubiquinone/menaquinone biosynthesis C-methylase UbiE